MATFPFSSVGPRLGDDLPLDLDALFDRIVARHRGGYCFEQNGLLFEVLLDLGYDVHVQLARVIYNRDYLPGLTHRVTRVVLDDRTYVADVGFGPLGPPVPVPMPRPMPDAAPDPDRSPVAGDPDDWTYRIHEPHPGEFHLQSRAEGAPFSLYRFDLVPYGPYDCEIGHFYSHRHPEATFVNNLVVSRILSDEIRSLRNREYWVIRPAGQSVTAIADASHLYALLRDELGSKCPRRRPDGSSTKPRDLLSRRQAADRTASRTDATASVSSRGTTSRPLPATRSLTASTINW